MWSKTRCGQSGRRTGIPVLRTDSTCAEEDRLVTSEWLANLSVAYVIRIPSGFGYLTEFELERYRITDRLFLVTPDGTTLAEW